MTRHNFRSKLEEVEEAIDSCSFLSIDGEFTGGTKNNFFHFIALSRKGFRCVNILTQRLVKKLPSFWPIQIGKKEVFYFEKNDS